MKAYKIKELLVVLFLMLTISTKATTPVDNTNYAAPSGTQLYYIEVEDANRTFLRMNQMGRIPEGHDGICVEFSLRADLSILTAPLKLLSLTTDTEAASFMDILYDGETLKFRRKKDQASETSVYYDYELFNPLFDAGSGGVTNWIIKIYFTEDTFFIETRNQRLPLNNKLHGLLLFGVSLPNNSIMYRYLHRATDAAFVFGSPEMTPNITMPNEIVVSSFNYEELRLDLQNNFLSY